MRLGLLVNFLWGYDFFISYRQNDGKHYAESLEKQLVNRGYSCFLDTKSYLPGSSLGKFGKYALKKTTRLILVGSPAVISRVSKDHSKDWVMQEIAIFAKLSKSNSQTKVIPINIGKSLSTPEAIKLLAEYIPPDTLWIPENIECLNHGASIQTIERIVGTFREIKRSNLRQITLVFIIIILAFLTLISATFWRNAETRSLEIENKKLEIESQKALTEEELERSNALLKDIFLKQADTYSKQNRSTASMLTRMRSLHIGTDSMNSRRGLFSSIVEKSPDWNSIRGSKNFSRNTHPLWGNFNLYHGRGRICFSPDGEKGLQYNDLNLKVWNLETGKLKHEIELSRLNLQSKIEVQDAKWVSNEKIMIVAIANDGTVNQIIYLPSNDSLQITNLNFITNGSDAWAFLCPKGLHLAVIEPDGHLDIWNLQKSYKIFQDKKISNDPNGEAVFSKTGRYFGFIKDNENFSLLDLEKSDLSKIVLFTKRGVRSFNFSKDDSQLAISSPNQVEILKTCLEHSIFKIKTDKLVEAMVFTNKDENIAIIEGDLSKTLSLWSLSDNTKPRFKTALYSSFNKIYDWPSINKLTLHHAYDDVFRIYDSDSLKLELNCPTHPGSLQAYQNEKRQELVITGGGFLKIWKLPQGQVVGKTNDHVGLPRLIEISPSGKTLATAGDDSCLRLWNAENGKLLGLVQSYDKEIKSIQFSNNENSLYVNVGNTLHIRNLLSPSQSSYIRNYNRTSSFALGTEESIISFEKSDITLSKPDGTVKLWDINTKKSTVLATGKRCFSSSKDGRVLAWGNKSIEIANLDDPQNSKTLYAPSESENFHFKELSLSATGKHLAALGNNNTIIIWNIESGQLIGIINNNNNIQNLQFTPLSRKFIFWDSSGQIVIYDLATNSQKIIPTSSSRTLSSLSISQNHKVPLLAFEGDHKTLELYSYLSGALVGSIEGHSSTITGTCFSPDSSRLYSCDRSGEIRCWDTSYSSPKYLGNPIEEGYSDFCISPEGNEIIACDKLGQLTIFDVHSGEKKAQTKLNGGLAILKIAISKSTNHLAIATKDDVVLFDYPSLNYIHHLKHNLRPISYLKFSQDGKWLGASGLGSKAYGSIVLWKVTSKLTPTKNIPLNEHIISDINFNSDGNNLIASDISMNANLWDLQIAETIEKLNNHPIKGYQTIYSKNGEITVTRKLTKIEVSQGTLQSYELESPMKTSDIIAMSESGDVIAAARNSTIYFWKAGKRSYYASLSDPHSELQFRKLRITPNSKNAFSLSENGILCQWNIPPSHYSPNINLLPFETRGYEIHFNQPMSPSLFKK